MISLISGLAVIAAKTVAPAVPAGQPVSLDFFRQIARPHPTEEISYGSSESQTVDVFLPPKGSLHPVVVLVHGGCWSKTTAGRHQLRHLASDLAQSGIAVWNVGYRRADEQGGGYPGTYQDMASAISLMQRHAARLSLDTNNVAIVGHSAGGHLALWAASRSRLPETGYPFKRVTVSPKLVIGLAAVTDLSNFAKSVPAICGDGIIESITGTKDGKADHSRLRQISPMHMPRAKMPVVLASGTLDRLIPPYMAFDYAKANDHYGEAPVERINFEEAGHFDLVTATSPAWQLVRKRLRDVLISRGEGSIR